MKYLVSDTLNIPIEPDWTLFQLTGDTLSLTHLNLTCIKFSISNLSNLTILNVQANALIELPLELYSLLHLTELNVSFNALSQLSPLLSKLVHLEELHVSHNQLTLLPQGLGSCHNLVSLNVSHNLLKTLPAEIRNLNRLRQFFVEGNKFSLLDVALAKSSSPLSCLDISLQAVGMALLTRPHLYCFHPPSTIPESSKRSPSPSVYETDLELLFKQFQSLAVVSSPSCIFVDSYPAILDPIMNRLKDPMSFYASNRCSQCESIVFHSGLLVNEVFVKCNTPVPIQHVFCSVSCRAHLHRGIREKSVANIGQTRLESRRNPMESRTRLRTWDGGSIANRPS